MKDNIYYNLKKKIIQMIYLSIYKLKYIMKKINIYKTLIYTGKNIKLFLKIINFTN